MSSTMVLGLRTKNRKGPSVQLDYLIHIQEVKPWPPSQSLRTLRAVLIQWEHGEKYSGSTNQVVPSLGTGSGVGDGRIEFNESFKLPVTLLREFSIKGGNGDTFQKNCIEFNLYEPRRDKTVKGQLLGTAIVDLAEYGAVKESLIISAPINCKRTYRNTAQPLLFIKLQPVEKNRTSSSSRDSLMREASMDRIAAESVSALMSEEYAEEAEVASFSDDDVSSHSSLAVSSIAVESNGGSPPQLKENELARMNRNTEETKDEQVFCSEIGAPESNEKKVSESRANSKGSSSRSSSIDLSSDLAWISKKIVARSVQSPPSCKTYEGTGEEQNANVRNSTHDEQVNDLKEKVHNGGSDRKDCSHQETEESASDCTLARETSTVADLPEDQKMSSVEFVESTLIEEADASSSTPDLEQWNNASEADVITNGSTEGGTKNKHQESSEEMESSKGKEQVPRDESLDILSQDETMACVSLERDSVSIGRDSSTAEGNISNSNRSKHVKSVRSPMDSGRSNGSAGNQLAAADTHCGARFSTSNGREDVRVYPKDTRSINSERKIQQLEQKIKMLEGELREAAAVEVSLYSVVAEHGSSTNKVHAPARRLSRLILNVSKERSKSRKGNAAKSAISGLVLVAKACGNDVPRLTFWLSNSVVLRAIISKSLGEPHLPLSAQSIMTPTATLSRDKRSSPLKWDSFTSNVTRTSDDWENPFTFIAALEKVEAWIFSRIIESIWWQTLTPHMQPGTAKAIYRSMSSNKNEMYRKTTSSCGQEQENFSLELWKKAFQDACDRICPLRAEGHECGCLPVLSRLIMEQCVARLDVAMFNAILRESADDIPTDPVSDPISDPDVLPIPPGKASFGAGAQLKNAIGNWSRWLTDLFGIDDDDSNKDEYGSDGTDDDERKEHDASMKSFHLLNALSDLMMLPKDMLLSRTIRKEVCPTFGAPLIRRVLNTFIPDEFCPDSIPRVVLEALNSEDPFEDDGDSVVNFPCAATPIVYLPPSADLVACVFGDLGSHSQLSRSGSSVLKKSYTSDDELDELDSPFSSLFSDCMQTSPSSKKSNWVSRESGSRNAVRYQLLREVWMDN